MSQTPESTPPAPNPPDETPAGFGAGAFEAAPAASAPTPGVPPAESAPLAFEAAPAVEAPTSADVLPPVIELPPPAAARPPVSASTPAPPPARPVVHEVEAVRVTRFDAPAPTIDVEARRAPPPPPVRPPEPVAPTTSAAMGAAAATSGVAGTGSAASTSSTPHAGPQPHGAPPPPSAPRPSASTPTSDGAASRWWSMFCHLFLFLALPTLFLGGLLTFVVWQWAGRKDALVSDQGREALNFQITVALVTALLFVSCLGSPLIPIVWFVAGVFCILAAVRAYSGESYRYPFILRIVRA